MTRFLLVVCLVAGLGQMAMAQVSPVVKLHAFRREVVPGAKVEGERPNLEVLERV